MNAERQIENMIEEFGVRAVLAVLTSYVDKELADAESKEVFSQYTLSLTEAKPHLEQACRELDA